MSMPYSNLTVADLKELLEERGLEVSGRKADLINRLLADDNPGSPKYYTNPNYYTNLLQILGLYNTKMTSGAMRLMKKFNQYWEANLTRNRLEAQMSNIEQNLAIKDAILKTLPGRLRKSISDDLNRILKQYESFLNVGADIPPDMPGFLYPFGDTSLAQSPGIILLDGAIESLDLRILNTVIENNPTKFRNDNRGTEIIEKNHECSLEC